MRTLPGPILGQLWPAEKIVMGMRACKWLREDLLRNAQRILLQSKWVRFDEDVSEQNIRTDLTRFYHASRTFAIRIGASEQRTFAKHSLSGCDALTSSLISALYETIVPQRFSDALPPSAPALDLHKTSELPPQAVTELTVERVNLCHSETCKFAMVIEACASSLTFLRVAETRLPPDAARMLSVQLSRCSNLTRLELSECGFQLGEPGAKLVAPALSNLRHLGMSRMGLGSQVSQLWVF